MPVAFIGWDRPALAAANLTGGRKRNKRNAKAAKLARRRNRR